MRRVKSLYIDAGLALGLLCMEFLHAVWDKPHVKHGKTQVTGGFVRMNANAGTVQPSR